ncbi:bifunctional lytic transglycosylase/C40 family peptidase [Bailinhaonella thermotolerans]|uniref:Hydrolase n=1 Tax=Bailinhaonella thermotolerans TaxID=1070861 RepID=A0A3A4BFW6_9ACTN|nr:bifunctional lytic transglycosylase/C40 family peptidase [Bailinhaonella thermotolerans]RJL33382.1 hydrolase [Bailinhaonella thermotolerans]
MGTQGHGARIGSGSWRRLLPDDGHKTLIALGVIAAMFVGLIFVTPVFMGTLPSFVGGGADCEVAPPKDSTQSGTARADIPADYLKLYQDAGREIGVQWNVLAAVGKRESDHGRSTMPGVQSGTNHAGAAGPMQFLISTWGGKAKIKMPSKVNGYATDGDGDGWADVYNPADAIPAAAKMLKRNGAPQKLEQALFAYNRAMWYVRQVLAIAKNYANEGVIPVPEKPAEDCDVSDRPGADQGPVVEEILAYAMKQRGKPYIWGGTGPRGFDCSGIIYMAYREAGLSIPRTTFGQWPFGVKIQAGTERPGDLVFFNSGPGTSANNPGHVGMVVSKGKMIEARCTRCGPIKVTSYTDRPNKVGFTRPLDHPAVRRQIAQRQA